MAKPTKSVADAIAHMQQQMHADADEGDRKAASGRNARDDRRPLQAVADLMVAARAYAKANAYTISIGSLYHTMGQDDAPASVAVQALQGRYARLGRDAEMDAQEVLDTIRRLSAEGQPVKH